MTALKDRIGAFHMSRDQRNITVNFLRLGQLEDDTWAVDVKDCYVTVKSFTTHGEAAATILDALLADGFDRFAQHAGGRVLEVWHS